MDSAVIKKGQVYSNSRDPANQVFGEKLGPQDVPEEINVCDCQGEGWQRCIGFPARPLGALASVLTIIRLIPRSPPRP